MSDFEPLPAPVRPRIPLPREDVERPWTLERATLANFQSLPQELQDRIFTPACTLQPYRIWPGTDLSPLAVDVPTTRMVGLVSRYCHRLVIKLLYRRIVITRPNALQKLVRTLSARPNFGRLVESLHVGPSRELPADWWPIRVGSIHSALELRTALGGSEYDDRRPGWCEPRHDFEVPYVPRETDYAWIKDRMRGISNAIESAARALDIDLKKVNKTSTGISIGSDVYTIRVFELQAAIELYLLELRRRHGGVTCGCGSGTLQYPCLGIVGLSDDVSSADVFWIKRAQLRDHMAGQRASINDFSHPLLFALCGQRWGAQDAQGRPHQGGGNLPISDGIVDEVDAFSLSPSSRQTRRPIISPELHDDLILPLPSTATVGGNLALLRALLALTPYLSSLSLTGFLERAILGTRPPPALQALESLTVGPPPARWQLPLRFHHATLVGLKRLRVCGAQLGIEEVEEIIGRDGSLPQLEEFHWSLPTKFRESSLDLGLMDIINLLLDFDEASSAVGGSGQQSKKRQRQVAPQRIKRARPLFIQVFLYPRDARRVLAAAPDQQLRAAWRNGTPVPGYNRFQVLVHRCYNEDGVSRQVEKAGLREMYEEGKEFWDAGAMLESVGDGASGAGDGDDGMEGS